VDQFLPVKIFVRIVQLGTFTAVAKDLGLTQSSVSKKMTALEASLGVKLLTRSSRQVLLTESGTRFYEHSLVILNEWEEAKTQAREYTQKPKGNLRINIPSAFGDLHVIPHLPQFIKLYPDITLDISSLERRVDLINEGIDIAIRIGELSDSSLIARKIGTSPRALIASPTYLKLHGAPTTLEELKHHNCLIYSNLLTYNRWHFWHKKKELSVMVSGSIQADSGPVLRKFVLAGSGMSVLPRWLIQNDLNSGALVAVLDEYRPTEVPINALYLQKHYVPLKVRCFVDYFEQLYSQCPIVGVC